LHGFMMSVRWSLGFAYGMGYWLGSNWAGILGTILIIIGIILKMSTERKAEKFILSTKEGDVASKISTLANEALANETSDDSNKWVCRYCNDKNSKSAVYCSSCGKYR